MQPCTATIDRDYMDVFPDRETLNLEIKYNYEKAMRGDHWMGRIQFLDLQNFAAQ